MPSADEQEAGYYDRTYERAADELYAAIGREAFGEEIPAWTIASSVTPGLSTSTWST